MNFKFIGQKRIQIMNLVELNNTSSIVLVEKSILIFKSFYQLKALSSGDVEN